MVSCMLTSCLMRHYLHVGNLVEDFLACVHLAIGGICDCRTIFLNICKGKTIPIAQNKKKTMQIKVAQETPFEKSTTLLLITYKHFITEQNKILIEDTNLFSFSIPLISRMVFLSPSTVLYS